jgi:two-component system, chemotaxis family, chemotaxis protein CheY
VSKAIVVDDSRAMRAILSRILRECGFEVREAANGHEALEVLGAGGAPALALLDWNMPLMDGFELLTHIRAHRDYDEMRVVMVTTECEPHQMTRALLAGADEYVMKPFTAEMLRDKLALIGVV